MLAAAISASAGHATADAFNADGVANGQSASQVIEFGVNHSVVNVTTTCSKFAMTDTTNPMSQLKGKCFGTMEIRGGAVQGNGVCVMDGLEGDRVLLGWVARRVSPKGDVVGYWTVNNGTGIWLRVVAHSCPTSIRPTVQRRIR